MNFRGTAGRQRRRSQAVIEITSLIDVVFLLLIFLLITTTFKQQEYAFVIDLPTSSSEQVTVSTDKTTVFITKEGDTYLLELPPGEAPGPPLPGSDKKVDAATLQRRLKALHEKTPDAQIAIRAEKSTSYQSMMDVVGTLQDIGFRNIWFPYQLEE